MAKQQAEVTAVESARAAVDRATDRKAALLARIASADAQHVAASVAFDEAILAAPPGAPVSDYGEAAGLVQAAASSAAALRRGMADVDADVANANAALALVTAEADDVRWRSLIERRIHLSRQIDAHSATFAALAVEWRESGAELVRCWPASLAMQSHHLDQIRNIRVIAWTIPAEMQNAIVQTGSVQVESLEEKTRSLWLQTVRGVLA